MRDKFPDRFNIDIELDEARKRFINRIHNEIYWGFLLSNHFSEGTKYSIARSVATHLGDRFTNTMVVNFVGDEMLRNLHAIEGVYQAIADTPPLQEYLSDTIESLLIGAERDLGISWSRGRFYPSGAKLLDDKLINDVLGWLRERKYENVLNPFEKGLRHLLETNKRQELAGDVITDMYESLEALSKIVTGRTTKDLSANHEAFIAGVKASESYKKLLRQYIEYANDFRHAFHEQKRRPVITHKEAESFAYLTGIFIRLAMP